jgi:hypothetical protein
LKEGSWAEEPTVAKRHKREKRNFIQLFSRNTYKVRKDVRYINPLKSIKEEIYQFKGVYGYHSAAASESLKISVLFCFSGGS